MAFYGDPLAISPFFPISCPFGVQSGLGLQLSSHVSPCPVPWLSSYPYWWQTPGSEAAASPALILLVCSSASLPCCMQAECRRTARVWDHPMSPTEVPGMPEASPRPFVSCQNHIAHSSGLGKQTLLWERSQNGCYAQGNCDILLNTTSPPKCFQHLLQNNYRNLKK